MSYNSKNKLMGNKAGAFKRTLTFTCDSSNPQGKRNNREEVEADFSIMGCDEIKVSVGPGLPMNSSKFKTSVLQIRQYFSLDTTSVLFFQHLDPNFRGKISPTSGQKWPNLGAK